MNLIITRENFPYLPVKMNFSARNPITLNKILCCFPLTSVSVVLYGYKLLLLLLAIWNLWLFSYLVVCTKVFWLIPLYLTKLDLEIICYLSIFFVFLVIIYSFWIIQVKLFVFWIENIFNKIINLLQNSGECS